MAVTVIGRDPATIVPESGTLIADVQDKWGDGWTAFPALEVEQVTVSAGSAGGSFANFAFRYGEVIQPWEAGGTFRVVTPNDAPRRWVRVRLERGNESQVVFIGRFRGQARDMAGRAGTPTDPTTSATGTLRLVAYGGDDLLRRAHVSEAFVDEPNEAELQRIGWLPSMNYRDARGFVIGNRSEDKEPVPGGQPPNDESFVFGEHTRWNHFHFLRYVLSRFIETAGGPRWWITGRSEIIGDMETVIQFEPVETVLSIVRKLIPRDKGLDFFVRPVVGAVSPLDEGFAIEIFPLSAREYTFGEVTLPRNENEVRIDTPWSDTYAKVEVIESEEQAYRTVRVVGGRIVTAFTLSADEADPTLEPGWTSDAEQEYNRGTPTAADDARLHDLYRQRERFRAVYQRFVVPAGKTPADFGANPLFDGQGNFVAVGASGAAYQTLYARLLTWLPLLEGYDYGIAPPFDQNKPGLKPGQRSPFAVVQDPDSDFWITAEQAGLNVSVEPREWGVLVTASPNHRLARVEFDLIPKSLHRFPVFDWRSLRVTMAVQSDQRLDLLYSVATSADPEPDEEKIVYVPEAELWFMAAGTVVGIENDPLPTALRTAPADTVLRNDSSLLYMTMSGAIARYIDARFRARVEIRGLEPWNSVLGHIVTFVDQGGYSQHMNAPITEVTLRADPVPTTSIRAGFALGDISQADPNDPSKPNPLREPIE